MFDFHFDWAENFAVNIESIDTHHKQYFKIARDIEQQLQIKCMGITDKQILDIVCDLREYAGYHFYEEERLMKETNYPLFIRTSKET
jgi:hemerythrin